MQHLPYLRTIAGHLPFAYIWPHNGQTAENRAKPSPLSRSPLNLSPDRKFPWPNGFSRRTRLSHEILPAGGAVWRLATGSGSGPPAGARAMSASGLMCYKVPRFIRTLAEVRRS
jgi:hypothetical protein